MWVDIQAPEGVTEKDYQFLPSKNDHFVSGKITRTFSTSKPGVYTFTFNALTYGGYEMKPVTVTINRGGCRYGKGRGGDEIILRI